MSNNKMLIDAGHPEETRVVMVRGNRVDEFDFESEHKTQLRGNIYLAKVTRVEPSLQAAFVDYGGNRHGFLAFSEIHPDYYQIPVADRQALLDAEAEDAREAAEAEALQEQAEEEAAEKPARKRRSRRRGKADAKAAEADESQEDSQSDDAQADDASADEAVQEASDTQPADEANETPAESSDADAESDKVADDNGGELQAEAEETTVSDAGDDNGGDNSGDNGGDGDTAEESDDDPTSIAAENDGDDVVSEPAKPKRKTTRRPRKKKDDDTKQQADADAATDAAAGDGEGESAGEANDTAESKDEEETPKPKRRRTSRVKAKAESDNVKDESETAIPDETNVVAATSEADESAQQEEKPKRRRTSRKKKKADEPAAEVQASTDESGSDANASDNTDNPDAAESADGAEEVEAKPRKSRSRSRSRRRKNTDDSDATDTSADSDNGDTVEELGSEDALEEVPTRRAPRRHYKIQEVIKRRQILLVQVVKEERGNKGAALTTYLSLAGRYSVLMPNTARGGGISRKITNASDRKRLKSIAANLEVPQGMGVILRTAGASRQPEDIQRDFEYLMRLWENVRNLTLESTAPYLVYEEGSLIKRSIRDMYDKDTGEILVAGEEGYREAKDFMTMLMPNHAKNVKMYRDRIPMFARMGVEAQLDAMLQPEVTLRSGGYIIIDQTEALVAIDVNSGRSTRQHSVEETAVQTNLEAADEVARQLRLRDLAGLIVIDFIDMEDKRNIRSVEKRLKEALKEDRARIQVGRISHFGLMEMSRQRIRASVLESTTQTCPVCEGLGHVRAPSSIAISVLRSIEEQLNRNSRNNLIVKVSSETALYILNNKRDNLGDLENRFSVSISIATDDSLGSTPCSIERGEVSSRRASPEAAVQPDSIELAAEDGDSPDAAPQQDARNAQGDANSTGKKRKRRRRRRKGGAGDNEEGAESNNVAEASQDGAEASEQDKQSAEPANDAAEETEKPAGRVKRTRRTRSKKAESDDSDAVETATDDGNDQAELAEVEEKPAKKRTRRKKAAKPEDEAAETASEPEASVAAESDEPAKPKRRTTRRKKPEAESVTTEDAAPVQMAESSIETAQITMEADAAVANAEPSETNGSNEPKKSGWWQRKFF